MTYEEDERRRKKRLPRAQNEEAMEMTTGQTVVATNLSSQLGSDGRVLSKGGVDMRRLTIIDPPLRACLSYFRWRGRKIRFWAHIVNSYENYSVSIGGIGRRQLIKMQAATTPGATMPPEPEEPSWVGRNITQRNWKRKGDDE